MPTVAEQLRRAREAQQLDVYQVADMTKIKTDHVRALESGDYEAFSAPVYIRGFVRTYATVLKLDVPKVIADLEAELSHSKKFGELPALSGKPKGPLDFIMLHLSQMNWRMVVALAALALTLILIVAGFRRCNSKPADGPLRRVGPGLYQPTNEPAERLPLPTGLILFRLL